jgi:hypothetical protein
MTWPRGPGKEALVSPRNSQCEMEGKEGKEGTACTGPLPPHPEKKHVGEISLC